MANPEIKLTLGEDNYLLGIEPYLAQGDVGVCFLEQVMALLSPLKAAYADAKGVEMLSGYRVTLDGKLETPYKNVPPQIIEEAVIHDAGLSIDQMEKVKAYYFGHSVDIPEELRNELRLDHLHPLQIIIKWVKDEQKREAAKQQLRDKGL